MSMKPPPFLRAFVVLGALVIACGPDEAPSPPAKPGTSVDAGTQADAGTDAGAWTSCEPEADTGVCGANASCVSMEVPQGNFCADVCSDLTPCQQPNTICCIAYPEHQDVGVCLSVDECKRRADAGTGDAGSPVDAGTRDGGSTGDAGPTGDAGTPDGGSTGDAGSPVDAGTADAGTDSGSGYTQIRIMAANITSGNLQSYDPGHGLRLMQGVNPDVVLIQEFNYKTNSVADIRGMVDSTFGTDFSYYREGGAQIPNGIISRFPIVESGEWKDPKVSNRDFAWARIDIPGPHDLWAVSVHLLTSSSGDRNAEAASLVTFIKGKFSQDGVPASDYLTIGGDFNTDSRSESCLTTFKQLVSTAGPHPADKNGKDGTNVSRSKPYDHVLVDDDLYQHRVPTVIGASSFPNGLVLDSRVYTPISEISPALSGDSSASNMQHMGVVKTFLTPNF
ncbi:endonuclease/exonuclease/phosphatase family protein [Corallococcus sicarius]|uniref:Endonuclease/exonuclease/phosphatase family protein n=1 Tax=Corallococcus sicarius TaxID=2316726 RepID=A0A3A8NH36_9BACT|nr:endonuclease/exonuclease/phosphatase family protein [Corallococcus sicarius]RKH41501.1 endonuclease/exonuclease/phosphatase family protein [Corallococcus sicarius]